MRACAQVNSTAVVLVSKGMVHLEGGWPKEVDCSEVEQTIRYRRKVPRSAPAPCAHPTWLATGGERMLLSALHIAHQHPDPYMQAQSAT